MKNEEIATCLTSCLTSTYITISPIMATTHARKTLYTSHSCSGNTHKNVQITAVFVNDFSEWLPISCACLSVCVFILSTILKSAED